MEIIPNLKSIYKKILQTNKQTVYSNKNFLNSLRQSRPKNPDYNKTFH